MKLIRSLVPICALLLPCALAAETFEGKVSMKITSADSKDGPQTLNYSIKPDFMRMDMNTAKGGGGFITDFKNRQMIILMPQNQMYMVKAMQDPSTAQRPPNAGGPPAEAAPRSTFKVTTSTETILGYLCTKYEVTTAKGVTEIWATGELGNFGGMSMGGGPGRRPQASQEWESAIKGAGFFPLRVVTLEDGKERFRMEATSVDKGSLPDSLFAAPDGWRKLDLGAMMGGMLPGGFGRPTNNN